MQSWRARTGHHTRSSCAGFVFGLLAAARVVAAYNLDLDSDGESPNYISFMARLGARQLTGNPLVSVKYIAGSVAQDMMSLYDGDKPGGVPGLLPQPYYCEKMPPRLFPEHPSHRTEI